MINWKIEPLHFREWGTDHEYLHGVNSVKVNDDNEQWCYNDGTWTVKNTEIWVEKGKPNLLVTLGESWTYGEGTEVINHRFHRWEIRDRIEATYSGKLARMIDSDLWTFGSPGNSNSGIFAGLFRILANIPRGKYNSVKVAVQMTACDRDRTELLPAGHALLPIYSEAFKHPGVPKISLREWFTRYDEAMFGMLDKEIEKNSDLNLDVVVFKNFNKIWTNRRDYNFRIIEPSWIKFNADYHNIALEECYVQHPTFYSGKLRKLSIVDLDLDFINQDLDVWEKYCKFLKTHNDTNHADHPTQASHILWTKFLYDQTGWRSVAHSQIS
jgi:hypothetical protein